MSTIRGNTATAVQARDLYNLMAPLLTTNGWTHVNAGTPVVIDAGVEWHVWRNPGANNGTGKEFHVAIGFGQSGTGSMFFRMFENWIGTTQNPAGYYKDPAATHGYGCARPVCRAASGSTPSVTAPSPDAYGLVMNLFAPGGNYRTNYLHAHQPIVRHDPSYPSTPPDFSGCTDYSAALMICQYSYFSILNEWTDAMVNRMLQIQTNGPLIFDFRSKFLRQLTLLADDETATEYVIHVSEKAIHVATRRIFNDDQDAIYAGIYEFASPDDPAPFFLHRAFSGTPTDEGCFTRVYKFNPDSSPWAITDGAYVNASADGSPNALAWKAEDLFAYTLRQYQPATAAPTSFNSINEYYKGPLTSRVGVMDGSNHFRGLMPESVMISQTPNPNSNPPIEFGDEATINGQDYIAIGLAGSDDVVKAFKNSGTSFNYQNQLAFWIIKD